jgi:hypothetical protein
LTNTPARRPTPEDFPCVFELMAGPELLSLTKACERLGLDRRSVSKAIAADDDLKSEYGIARQERGDGYGEKVAEVAQATLTGEYDPKAARAAMDGFKWTAARMAPKDWGDRVAVDHAGQVGVVVNVKRFTPDPEASE